MNETVESPNEVQPGAAETHAGIATETPTAEALSTESLASTETPVVPAVPAPVGAVEEAAYTSGRGHRKVRVGAVVSNKMQKSIVVTIERRVKHPLYKKYFTKTSRLMAHDELQEAKVGDLVKIVETRPLSKRKCWRLVEIVERAK